jgi:hypothetical protein
MKTDLTLEGFLIQGRSSEPMGLDFRMSIVHFSWYLTRHKKVQYSMLRKYLSRAEIERDSEIKFKQSDL